MTIFFYSILQFLVLQKPKQKTKQDPLVWLSLIASSICAVQCSSCRNNTHLQITIYSFFPKRHKLLLNLSASTQTYANSINMYACACMHASKHAYMYVCVGLCIEKRYMQHYSLPTKLFPYPSCEHVCRACVCVCVNKHVCKKMSGYGGEGCHGLIGIFSCRFYMQICCQIDGLFQLNCLNNFIGKKF